MLRHVLTGAQRDARLADEAVDQPAQRRGGVRVRGRDRGVQRLLGHLAVEGDVRRAAQQRGGVAEQRRLGGHRRVQGAHHRGVVGALGPGDAEREGGPAQALDVAGVGRRQGAQHAGAAVEHDPGRGHAGEQRDLRVPVLDRQRGPAGQRPPAARVDLDLLLGRRQGEPAARDLGGLAQPADLAQQHERLRRGAVVQRPLRPRVGQLRAAAHHRAAHADGGRGAVGVQVEVPEQRGRVLVGQQAGGALGQRGRVQRGAAVRPVQGDHPAPGLRVQRAARAHPRGDVGDGVAQPVPGSAPLQVHRLVEVAGPLRVDRDEGDVGRVGALAGGPGGRARGQDGVDLREHRGRERRGHLELGAQRVETRPDGGVHLPRGGGVGGAGPERHGASGHVASVGRAGADRARTVPGPCPDGRTAARDAGPGAVPGTAPGALQFSTCE